MGQFEQDRNYLAAERYCGVSELLDSTVVPASPKFTFSVESDFAVVGHNPEMADYDNPRGEIIREVFYMVATDADGRQYRFGNAPSEATAELIFQHIAPPVEHWNYFRCVYGSLAYQREGCETETLHWELESELGPDYLNNPQVQNYLSHAL